MTEMTLLEAAKWVDRNCSDENVKRIRSRAVAKVLFDEVRRQEKIIKELSKADEVCPQCGSEDCATAKAYASFALPETDYEVCDDCGHQWGHR